MLLITSQLQVALTNMAHRDELTGLLNRRGVEQLIGPELLRRRKLGSPVSAITMDVDGMKEANDRWGHLCGDALLVAVCGRLTEVAGKQAEIARLGGDEFLLVMPGAAMEDAMRLAERLRVEVEQVVPAPWCDVSATGSFGVTSKSGAKWTLEELMRESDQALLTAKLQGKNCVVAYVGQHGRRMSIYDSVSDVTLLEF